MAGWRNLSDGVSLLNYNSSTETIKIKIEYDSSIDNKTVDNTPTPLRNLMLPPNIVITRAYYEITQSFTSENSLANIAIGISSDDVDGILTSINISSLSLGFADCIQNGMSTNFSNKTTDVQTINFNITNEDLLTGKLYLYLEYIMT